MIRDLVREEGMTTLISTHEMGSAREVADRIVVFDNGDIIESGLPASDLRASREPADQDLSRQSLEQGIEDGTSSVPGKIGSVERYDPLPFLFARGQPFLFLRFRMVWRSENPHRTR